MGRRMDNPDVKRRACTLMRSLKAIGAPAELVRAPYEDSDCAMELRVGRGPTIMIRSNGTWWTRESDATGDDLRELRRHLFAWRADTIRRHLASPDLAAFPLMLDALHMDGHPDAVTILGVRALRKHTDVTWRSRSSIMEHTDRLKGSPAMIRARLGEWAGRLEEE